MTPIRVIIVAYRSDDHLHNCLLTLGNGLDVLVVDNSASRITAEICQYFGANYMASQHNLGFAGAVNRGLAASPGHDVLLLNPDARIDLQSVLALQGFLRDPMRRRAAVGPALTTPEGLVERASWPLPSPTQAWAEAVGLGGRFPGRRFVTGAVLLLRSEAIEEIGGFDERYFLYAEESDWQRRAQDAGWEVAVDVSISAEHVGGASSSDNDRRDFHFLTSNRSFARRWYGTVGAVVMRAAEAAAATRRAAVGPDRRAGRRRLMQSLRLQRPPDWTPAPSVVHVVCTDSFAGVERSVLDIATEQYLRGWRVVVIGGDPRLMRARLPLGVMTFPGGSVISAVRSLHIVGSVDVVHAHMTAAELAAALTKWRTHARVLATRHFAAKRGSTLVGGLVGRLAARSIDQQIAISRFVASAVDGPVAVVLNGVTASDVAATNNVKRDKTVLVLQRLEAEKQTDVAIQAWALSGLAGAGWTMTVHGRGSDEEHLRQLAETLGCRTSIHFAGFTTNTRSVLASAAALLASAPAEPFGLSVAEAMAEGTPVVASDGGAHREVLGDDGIFFKPGDAQGAASALRALAALDEKEREALGSRLQHRQRQHFTIQSQAAQLAELYRGPRGLQVAMLSLEPWDEVWRRNQHLASRLVRSGVIDSLLFIAPARRGLSRRSHQHRPQPGIEVVTPPLILPRRAGGHVIIGMWLRRRTRDSQLWWVNDPVAGDAARRPGAPTIYDVTDDWREMAQPPRDRRRIVRAEDRLAQSALTVVCSEALASRWRDRYNVHTSVIGNAVDTSAIQGAMPRTLSGLAPHIVYVGTAHTNRVDVQLLRRLAADLEGTLHLVGPEELDASTRTWLDDHGANRQGKIPSSEVATWLVSADVLICPHLVDDFTLSLDAIKSYEYLATRLPVVATPSSGFEHTVAPGLTVVDAEDFVDAVKNAVGTGPFDRVPPPDWDDRARQFEAALLSTFRQYQS